MRQVNADLIATNNDIRKLSFYSPSAGFIASTGFNEDWIGFTTDSGRTILKRHITGSNVNYNGYNVNLTFGFGIKGVKAFNQDTLLAYGDYGFVPSVLYSTNGGQTFSLVFHSQYTTSLYNTVLDMVFPQNGNTGYATDGYRVLKTTNKGLNWSTVNTDVNAVLDALDAIDNNTVFCFSRWADGTGSGRLQRTINGGVTWQQINIPDPRIYAADFITANKGWVSINKNGTDNLIYYTSDGGATWTEKNHKEASPILLNKMQFVNDSTGYGISEPFFTYKTSDTGRVWERIPRDNNFEYLSYGHNDLQVINPNQLWSGGARDFLEINTNATTAALPGSFFTIDTTGVKATGIVKLINYSKRNYQYKWFVNNTQISTAYNTEYNHTVTGYVDSVMLVVSNGLVSDTVKKHQYFFVPNLPVITSFSPASGSTGTSVLIYGSSFSGLTSVKFGGIPAATFTILNDNTIRAIVAGGASGQVSVTDINGTYSLGTFLYFPPPASPPPVITSFSPQTGPAGTTITITGQNFGPGLSSNTVSFGASQATILSASATQIICKVPAGATYAPFSVLNHSNGLSCYSKMPFNITFSDSGNFTRNSFITAYVLQYPSFMSTKYATGCDLDGDSKPDLLVTKSFNGDSLLVFRNTSPGAPAFSFGPPLSVDAVGSLSAAKIIMEDVDGDSKKDIICPTNIANVFMYRNLSSPGLISFSPRITVAETGPGTQDVAFSDFDGDGKPDMAVSAFNNQTLTVHRNTSSPGNISFAYRNELLTGGNTRTAAIGDLDSDGKPDIVTLNYVNGSSSTYSYFKNQSTVGNIIFNPAVTANLSTGALNGQGIWLSDYDNDSKPDIIITTDNANYFIRNISIPGSISLAPAITESASFIHAGTIASLSGDSKPDFLYCLSAFDLMQNTSVPGSISNNPTVRIQGEDAGAYTASAVDFNLDGRPDIVTSEPNQHKVTIYENKMGAILPFSTTAACAGGAVQRISDLTGNTYQWQQDANDGNGFVNLPNTSPFSGVQTATLNINNTPFSSNGYLYRCVVNGSLYSSRFRLTVQHNLTPTATITTPSATVCAGSYVTFTATAVNAGPSTGYNWQVNGVFVGNNSPVYTTNTLINGSVVRVYISNPCSNPSSTFSNSITMTVNGGTPQVSVSTSSTSVCAGAAVTFTSNTINAGTAPVYQWQVNGVNAGTNSATFTTSTLQTGDQIKVLLTATPTSCGGFAPVSSNTLIMTVNNPLTPDITISGNTTVVSGNSSAITAAPLNGGTSPQYQWQDSTALHSWQNYLLTSSAVINYTAAATGNKLRCILISNAVCATPVTDTSNVLTFTVNTATGLNPVSALQYGIRHFPNPVQHTLYLDSLKITDQWQTLAITGTDGRTLQTPVSIHNRTTVTLDVQGLPAATYIAVLRRKNGESVYLRFVKQ